MIKTLHKNEDTSLTLKIDREFRGILRGFAHDVSEGCVLNGELVMEVHRRMKIKTIDTTLTGICRVNFKTTNGMGVPTPDGSENRGIYRKRIVHFDESVSSSSDDHIFKPTVFEPGTYKFRFSFNIPAVIPQTFKGKHGSIEYELSAVATRGMFSPDIRTTRWVVIRRCLMNDISPFAQATHTVYGKMHTDIVTYSATLPSMVYCEGGLLALGFNVQLKDPENYSVRVVTCGLQEKVRYRTTGKNSLTNQAMHYNEISYPLGCSTFFPSQHPEYNPAELHNYNAMFRLYPRVHTDNSSSLIVVRHFLIIRMIIDNNKILSRKKSTDSSSSSAVSISSGGNSFLSHLSLRQHSNSRSLSKSVPIMSPISVQHTIEQPYTPPLSRSPSPSEISVDSMSGDSISSSPSLTTAMEQMDIYQSNIVKVSSRKLHEESFKSNQLNDEEAGPSFDDINDDDEIDEPHHLGHSLTIHHHFNPFKFFQGDLEEGSYECRLSVPIIVTSREEYREGSVPALPDYETTVDEPPSYLAAIQALPPVPIYPSSSDTNRQHDMSDLAQQGQHSA
ncbi:MAG: hypothetical protein EXX96DRAFT_552448 [Benjaminiella poitrasii]|nr:MAG: hypothetical protein EXX96DRAFT_552448 [Benjaminiella poitrasii]